MTSMSACCYSSRARATSVPIWIASRRYVSASRSGSQPLMRANSTATERLPRGRVAIRLAEVPRGPPDPRSFFFFFFFFFFLVPPAWTRTAAIGSVALRIVASESFPGRLLNSCQGPALTPAKAPLVLWRAPPSVRLPGRSGKPFGPFSVRSAIDSLGKPQIGIDTRDDYAGIDGE
jgi:hypothetical protein